MPTTAQHRSPHGNYLLLVLIFFRRCLHGVMKDLSPSQKLTFSLSIPMPMLPKEHCLADDGISDLGIDMWYIYSPICDIISVDG